MPIYQIILVIAVVILVLSLLLNLLFSPITWIIIAILVIYSFIRRYLANYRDEDIQAKIAEKKAAYQSGQAYRNGSDDVIDVNYVEKDENE